MKNKYVDMKKQLAIKVKEVMTVQAENANLSRRWEEDLKEKEEIETEWKKAYEAQIRDLNKIIESYKTQMEERLELENFQFSEACQFEYVRGMIQRKTDDIAKLNVELNAMSINKSLLSETLRDVKREMQKWRASATHRKAEYELLKVNVEELKLKMATAESSEYRCPRCDDKSPETMDHHRKTERQSVYKERLSIMKQKYSFLRPSNAAAGNVFVDDVNAPAHSEKLGSVREEEATEEEKENVGRKTVVFASDTKSSSGVTTTTERPRRSTKGGYKTIVVRSNVL